MDNKNVKPRGRPSAKAQILDAAETVVAEVGANHLTLEAVAERAGVSKGGLLYHFPTKEALLQNMVRRFVEEHATRLEELCACGAATPDARFQAILACQIDKNPVDCRMATSMLAASAENPQLLDPIREEHEARNRSIRETSDPDFARLLWLAAEGLMIMEMMATSPFDEAERARVTALLKRLGGSLACPATADDGAPPEESP